VQVDAAASWEVDLWDRIGNEAKARKQLAQAEAATVESVRLSLQAELADAYITLRGLDRQAKVYRQTAATSQDSPHSQIAPNISWKTGCTASMWANCSTRGRRRCSGMVGMSS